MEIYFLRHGESESNAGLADTHDSNLTPLGRRQAEAAADALSDIPFDRIYCSPLLRAMETAHLVTERAGSRPRVWTRLCEMGWCEEEPGAGRSVLAERFPSCELPPEVDEDGWARHQGGESLEECWERMGGVVAELRRLRKERPYARVLVVGHGGSGSVLLSHLIGLRVPAPLPGRADWLSVFFEHHNCGITAVDLREVGALVRFVNRTRHLAGLSEGERTAPQNRDPERYEGW